MWKGLYYTQPKITGTIFNDFESDHCLNRIYRMTTCPFFFSLSLFYRLSVPFACIVCTRKKKNNSWSGWIYVYFLGENEMRKKLVYNTVDYKRIFQVSRSWIDTTVGSLASGGNLTSVYSNLLPNVWNVYFEKMETAMGQSIDHIIMMWCTGLVSFHLQFSIRDNAFEIMPLNAMVSCVPTNSLRFFSGTESVYTARRIRTSYNISVHLFRSKFFFVKIHFIAVYTEPLYMCN